MRGYPQKVQSMSGSFLHPLVWLVEFQLIMMKVLALFQLFMPISAFYFYFSTLFHSVFYRHFSVFPHFSVCPHFSVLSPFQRFIPISAFYPHFSVLSPFQRFIPISAFYPHFSVLSPFQRFILISAFYPHFSVLFPFQFPLTVSVSAIQAPVTLYRITSERHDFYTGLGCCLHYAIVIRYCRGAKITSLCWWYEK